MRDTISRSDLDFEKDTYLADFHFDEKFIYLFFRNGVLSKISYDGRNKTIIKIDLAPNEFVISADLSGRDNIVLSTSGKNTIYL